jgi:hypothetical protein
MSLLALDHQDLVFGEFFFVHPKQGLLIVAPVLVSFNYLTKPFDGQRKGGLHVEGRWHPVYITT